MHRCFHISEVWASFLVTLLLGKREDIFLHTKSTFFSGVGLVYLHNIFALPFPHLVTAILRG